MPQVPPPDQGINLSMLRFERQGGPNDADLAHRQELFNIVGSLAVAGGHVEAAMRRLIPALHGHLSRQASESILKDGWGDLEKRLLGIVTRQNDSRSLGVRDLLAQHIGLRDQRDSWVHGEWQLVVASGTMRLHRWGRGASKPIIIGTYAECRAVAARAWEYATDLDAFLGSEHRAVIAEDA